MLGLDCEWQPDGGAWNEPSGKRAPVSLLQVPFSSVSSMFVFASPFMTGKKARKKQKKPPTHTHTSKARGRAATEQLPAPAAVSIERALRPLAAVQFSMQLPDGAGTQLHGMGATSHP